jgi:type I restriction enzyme S subunit
MSEWKEYKLRDICSDISYGYTASANDEPVGPKFLRITDIVSDRILWDTVPFCKIDADLKARYKLDVGDIVIARTGATTGYNAIIKEPVDAVFASYLVRYKVDRSIADPFYVSYLLKSNEWKGFVENVSGGSAQPGANAQQLADFQFLLPPLPEQRAIASVLSSLDDKIDLLHRQNKTLESLAETLFRQWFVEEAEEGWEEKGLDEIADYLNGLACQKYPAENAVDRLPVIKIKELRRGFTEASDWATSRVPSKYIIETGDVIFSWSGSLEVVIWAHGTGVLNQHLFKVTSQLYPKWFYYLATKSLLPEFQGIAEDKATTMGHIQRHHLSDSKILVPPIEDFPKLDQTMKPILDRMIVNLKSIRTLTQMRDTLLPKLMSGEIRVKSEQ